MLRRSPNPFAILLLALISIGISTAVYLTLLVRPEHILLRHGKAGRVANGGFKSGLAGEESWAFRGRVAQKELSKSAKIHSGGGGSLPRAEVISFSKLDTHGELSTLGTFRNLTFSPHFLLAKPSEFHIPPLSPSPQSLLLTLVSSGTPKQRYSPPTISTNGTLFDMPTISLLPTRIIPKPYHFNTCISSYREKIPLCWGCRLVVVTKDEKTLWKKVQSMCSEWGDKVEVEIFVDGKREDFLVWDLEIERKEKSSK